MATAVIMPRQGQSVESCIITKIHKQKGESVAQGEPLFTYETDKSTFDEESKVSGTVLDVFFEEGDDVPCLTNVLVIGEPGEDAAEFAPGGGEKEAAAESAPEESAPEDIPAPVESAPAPAASGQIKISPRARGEAERSRVDFKMAEGTGPGGRIIERDINRLIESGAPRAEMDTAKPTTAPPAAGSYEEPVSNIRKTIARAMHTSLSTMAQLTLNGSFDASEIMAYRAKIKDSAPSSGLANITLNDMVLYALSRVLLNHRDLNANFDGEKMVYFGDVNLGMAVDTPRGLMVPTIFAANRKTLNEIAAESKKLADECKNGAINPDYLRGGSFTATNLGSLGVESFTPVINPPQTGILGINNITQRVKKTADGHAYYPAMGLSLTFDHRAVDGAPAARMLKDLCAALENFSILLAR